MKRMIVWALAFLAWISAALAGMVTCPDCKKEVSDRALLCPHCGCPGDIIRAAAKAAPPGSDLPPISRSLLHVITERGTGVGVCVESAEGVRVATSQDLLAGARSITLGLAAVGAPVAWSAIELADDRNLARLVIAPTSAHAMAISAGPVPTNGPAGPFRLVLSSTGKACVLMPAEEKPGAGVPLGTPYFDPATNAIALLADRTPTGAVSLVGVPKWIAVEPAVYRKQSGLLREFVEFGAGSTAASASLREELDKTKWPTTYLRARADAAIQRLKKAGRAP